MESVMEIIGTIVSKTLDYTIVPVARRVRYVTHWKSNIQRLESRMEVLEATKGRVEELVEEAMRQGRRNRTEVMTWLRRVDAIKAEVSYNLAKTKVKCHLGFRPNLITRCQLSRKVMRMVLQVEELLHTYEFGFESDRLGVSWDLQAKNYVDFTYLNEIGFPNLRRLAVHRCDGLSFLLSSSMAKYFPHLEHLRISECQNMEEIVSTEGYGEENGKEVSKNMFPKLEQLELSDLPYLTRFCSGSHVEFSALKRLHLDKCTRLETFIFNHLSNSISTCGEMASNQENVETSAPRFLFDKKVELPRLERLTINDLPRLTTIWHTQLAPESFRSLKEITVQHCSLLRNILPASIITRVYQSLQSLTVEFSVDNWWSRSSPEVFCVEADLPGNSSRQTNGFVPQSLKSLRLQGIEIKFMRFSKQTSVFPFLEILELKFCGLNNLELSAISFRNLTILEVTFCWRLQYLTTYSVAQSLGRLERLKIDECKVMKEIFTSEGIGEDTSNCEIVFSRLQHLELSDLISLERFCSRKCTVKVPSLKSSALQVNWCPFQLMISTDGVLEEVVSDMHQAVPKLLTRREEVLDPIGSACCLETNQKQHVPFTSEVAEDVEFKNSEFNAGPLHEDVEFKNSEFNAGPLHEDRLVNDDGPLLPDIAESSEQEVILPAVAERSERGVEAVIQESPINLKNSELAEIKDLKQKQIVINIPKNVQEAESGMEECLIERLDESGGRPLQLRTQSISKLAADIKLLQEALRAKEAEMRDKQQKLADGRLATVD